MAVMASRGKWVANKYPVAWRYEIDLICSVCGMTDHIAGEAREGMALPDMGYWRKVQPPHRGHSDPLAEEAVVCGRRCANEFVADCLSELFREP